MNPVNAHLPARAPVSATPAGYRAAKRTVDVAASAAILALASPLLLLIALAVSLDSPGSALFRQRRVGRNGVPFLLFKFRSMRRDAPNLPTADMLKQTASPVTRVGAFLRRTSLDELPQLVNVLKGEMSLVGPRPALPAQAPLNELRARAGVDALLPGLTGWAQINGRDELSDTQKVAHDTYYLHHRCLRLDLSILSRTFAAVLSGKGNR